MRRPVPLLAWLLGWLLPGAGHAYAGRRAQGLVLGLTLTGCFAAGAVLGRGAAVTPEHPEYLVLQCGAGLPAGAAWLLSDVGGADVSMEARETAVLYTLVPALLNLVAALEAAALAAAVPAPAAAAPPPVEAAPAEPREEGA